MAGGLAVASESETRKEVTTHLSKEPLGQILSAQRGLCIQIGYGAAATDVICANSHLVLHCLCSDGKQVEQARKHANSALASVIVERWEQQTLPHLSNLASVIVVNAPEKFERSEVLRVLSPGASAYFVDGDRFEQVTKQRPPGMGSWTHQWHDSDGGLTTDDQYIDVPTGLQWLSGPSFAMAGRKNSTQSLVSASGINFYVTQNVLENVGKPEMAQYLVARDAFNGMVLWQRPWTGTFVTGNGETNARIVAAEDRLFVAGETNIQAIEMSTGDLIGDFPLPQSPDKLAFAFGKLYVQTLDHIIAIEKNLASESWEFEASRMSGMVISDDVLLTLVSGRSSDGRFQHLLYGLDPLTGGQRFSTNTQDQLSAASVRVNFAQDGLVALQAHGSLHLYSAEDGEHLWSKETDARPGKSYVDERYVGHFYRHGLVWLLRENSPRESLGQNTWVGLDAKTGKFVRELSTKGAWPETATPAKMGCQLLIASDRYIMIPRQSTFIDFDTGEKLPFKFTRGGCGLGFVPANGLVYSHPHACGCFSEATRGFMGMHSIEPPRPGNLDENRLTKGEAYGKTELSGRSKSLWPMHRGGVERTAYAPTNLGSVDRLLWSQQIADVTETPSLRSWKLRTGNLVSPATVADDTLYVADVDRGVVKALDIRDGQTKWSYSAAARVDTSPTIYRGLCLFGSHDGYVTCLRAGDGALVWKYRAAPMDRRMLAYGSVESNWPVSGTVLVQGGLAFVAAGRAPDADGGIEVHAIDPLTGIPSWTRRVGGVGYKGVCDFLVGD
ncbi:MAG TPA: hypothetical protein DDW52_01730, partial [Planctomycetaceae bacterium]|nr:hypothetical protein [Planctomycetaceae bacterium]